MKRVKLLVTLVIILAALVIPPLVLYTRSPALIITDAPFTAVYGTTRLKQQQISVSLRLFRMVKPVTVADGASPDIIIVAISEAAAEPFCVLFPRRHASAAERYHEEFPEIPCVLLIGLAGSAGHTRRSDLPAPDGLLYVYETDRDTDLYRAGLLAGVLADLKQKPAVQAGEDTPIQQTFALWQDSSVTTEQREFFSRGARERDPESAVVFAHVLGEAPDAGKLSCMVLTGAGSEYLERNPKVPVILFSWLDPALTSKEVFVLFDDSPWGLAVPAVRMAEKGETEGKIPSKPLIISEKIADKGVFRTLKKSAKKTPNLSETLTKN